MPESIKNDKCKIKKIKKSYKTFSTNIINIQRKTYWTIKMILKLLAPSFRTVKQNDTHLRTLVQKLLAKAHNFSCG